MRPRVVLHIERVVLNGYASADRLAIAEGLRDELARHYGDAGAVQALRGLSSLDRLHAGRTPIAAGAEPGTVGRQAARAITKGLAP